MVVLPFGVGGNMGGQINLPTHYVHTHTQMHASFAQCGKHHLARTSSFQWPNQIEVEGVKRTRTGTAEGAANTQVDANDISRRERERAPARQGDKSS